MTRDEEFSTFVIVLGPFGLAKSYPQNEGERMCHSYPLKPLFLFVLLVFIVCACATTVPYNRAKVERVQLLDSLPSRPFTIIKHIEGHAAGVGAFSSQPSMAEAEHSLKEKAAEVDADAVINLKYSTGMSLWATKNAWVEGDAIKWK